MYHNRTVKPTYFVLEGYGHKKVKSVIVVDTDIDLFT